MFDSIKKNFIFLVSPIIYAAGDPKKKFPAVYFIYIWYISTYQMDATHQLPKCAEITMNLNPNEKRRRERKKTKTKRPMCYSLWHLDSFTLFPSVVNKFFIRSIDVYWWHSLSFSWTKTICWFSGHSRSECLILILWKIMPLMVYHLFDMLLV